jgi:hypothetical protein
VAGYFVLPGLCYDVSLLEDGHLIELDDGRAGKIVITRLSPNDGGETTTVSFVGSGSIK